MKIGEIKINYLNDTTSYSETFFSHLHKCDFKCILKVVVVVAFRLLNNALYITSSKHNHHSPLKTVCEFVTALYSMSMPSMKTMTS